MTKVHVSGTIPAPVDEVWQVVGDFGGIADWLPPLASSGAVAGASGTQVGDTRTCTIDGGPTLTEKLTSRSDADYTYSYAIAENPLPMENYKSTIKLHPQGDQTVLEWTGTFDPEEGQEEEVTGMVKGVYQAGIDHLMERFG